jgi:AcrR family transcriptional regulator
MAAQIVFDEMGYTHATVDAITAEAKVSTGTFYGYFRDKRQLLLVAVGEALDVLAGDLGTFELSPDPFTAIERFVEVLADPEGGFHGLWRAWSEAAAQDPELARCDQKITAWISGILLDAMQRVDEPLHLRPGLDRPTTAHLIAILLRQLSLGVSDPPGAVIQAASSMIYHTLFRDRPANQRAEEAR